MMKRHCDVCGEEMERDRSHIWANTLPQDDPLRNISAQITFFGSPHRRPNHDRDNPVDVCDGCFVRWLRGIRGVIDPNPVYQQSSDQRRPGDNEA